MYMYMYVYIHGYYVCIDYLLDDWPHERLRFSSMEPVELPEGTVFFFLTHFAAAACQSDVLFQISCSFRALGLKLSMQPLFSRPDAFRIGSLFGWRIRGWGLTPPSEVL